MNDATNEPDGETVTVNTGTQHAMAITELQPMIKSTTAYASTIEGMEIHDDEQLGLAGDLKKDLAHYRRKLEDKRTSLVQPLNKVVGDINAMFKAPRDRIDGLVDKLGKKMTAYITRQEQIEKQKREDEAREAREREERLRAAAESTREAVGDDGADMVEVLEEQADAAAEEAVAVVAPTRRAAPTRGMKSTVSKVRTWKGEVVDVKAACRAIAEGRLPAGLVSFSTSELNAMAKAGGKEHTVDGIKYSQELKAGVR